MFPVDPVAECDSKAEFIVAAYARQYRSCWYGLTTVAALCCKEIWQSPRYNSTNQHESIPVYHNPRIKRLDDVLVFDNRRSPYRRKMVTRILTGRNRQELL